MTSPATHLDGSTINAKQCPYSVVAGDLTGDGKLDIVTANDDSGSVSVLLNSGGNGRDLIADFTPSQGDTIDTTAP